MCKKFEGVVFPIFVEAAEDGKGDPLRALNMGEDGHRSSAPPHRLHQISHRMRVWEKVDSSAERFATFSKTAYYAVVISPRVYVIHCRNTPFGSGMGLG